MIPISCHQLCLEVRINKLNKTKGVHSHPHVKCVLIVISPKPHNITYLRRKVFNILDIITGENCRQLRLQLLKWTSFNGYFFHPVGREGMVKSFTLLKYIIIWFEIQDIINLILEVTFLP